MPAPHKPIKGQSSRQLSSSPIAQESLARDIAECDDREGSDHEGADRGNGPFQGNENPISDDDDSSSTASTTQSDTAPHSMAKSYRRPSFVAYGGTRPTITAQQTDPAWLTRKERKQSRNEERSLLQDNHITSPKHHEHSKRGAISRLYLWIFGSPRPIFARDEETPSVVPAFTAEPSETSALLGPGPGESTRSHHERLNRQWEEAVASGKIKTTWQREAKTLWRYASPLVVTFILQYSLTVASIFTVGHIGKVELGAVSLGSMTANITGYAVYQGLATSLDTLCAQAYGSGRKKLVGLQLQRMVYFLWVLTIPIGLVWLSAEKILERIVPEKRSAELAGLYLRVLLLGAPGYACFESGKRFLQAQGLFSGTTYVLLIAAPLNAFMNWLFVWHFKWGFVGAPIAVVVTDNLLPVLLFCYVYFIDGKQCWNGFTRKAFHNWGPMVRLALPGFLMVEAEFLAFEILTLASSYFSTSHLAAQSILSTLTALTFQIPFPVSVAASTRVANLIGATLADAAKTSAKVAFCVAVFVGLFNAVLLFTLRNHIPQLFTNDQEVIELVSRVLPLCVAFQLFDALAANCNGILRGLGRQEIGGWVNLFCYYVVAMPISFGTAFGLHWNLEGLWTGVAIALGLVSCIEGWFLYQTSWEQAVKDAEHRNTEG